MIPENVFSLDTVYEKVTLTENENTYALKFEFENDTVYNITDIVKTIEFTKHNFFTVKKKRTSKWPGNKTATQTVVSEKSTKTSKAPLQM